MGVDAKGRNEKSAAPAQGRDDACLARAGAFEPVTEDRGGRSEENKE